MKNNIYVLNQRQDETFDAAGKAMRDVFSVLADKKAKIIWSVPKHCSKYLKLLDLPYLVLFLLFCVKKSDSVFYSIPENHTGEPHAFCSRQGLKLRHRTHQNILLSYFQISQSSDYI